MRENIIKIVYSVFVAVFIAGVSCVNAQDISIYDLDQRLSAIEEYLEKLPPSMATYVGGLEESINNYTKNLEQGLAEYSSKLEANLETRLTGISHKTIELDPRSRSYQRIDTPTGMFFIAVQDIQPISGGHRLYLQVGNPNFADFNNFKLRLVWGDDWNPDSSLTYEQWRESLKGAQYSYKGSLERGKWNPIEVDLISTEKGEPDYIECELGIGAIILETKQ